MKNKKILIIALIFSIVLSISSIVLAIDNPDFYKPDDDLGETTIFSEMVSSVLGVISVIGIFVAVAGIMIIGIKTIFGSVEEKADYKKKINVAPSPMVARYYVYPKKRNSKIKLQSIKNR